MDLDEKIEINWSDPKLQITQLQIVSRAKRIFYLFKPKEPVFGETFDIGLTIRNMTKETYTNGYIECYLDYPNAEQVYDTLQFPFDVLRPDKQTTLWCRELTVLSQDLMVLSDFVLVAEGKPIVSSDRLLFGENVIPGSDFLFNAQGKTINGDNPLIINTANKEELYQKYSVVVAIWTAILSIVISVTSLVYGLFFK